MKKYVKSFNTLEDKRNANRGYKYIMKHGLGTGTLPKDVNIIDWVDNDDWSTTVWLDRPLSTEELNRYDIPSETDMGRYIKEGVDVKSSYYDYEFEIDEDPYTRYVELAHKSVPDADGFLTDYTLYKDRETGEYFCMFGDNELYPPDPSYADMEFETNEREAYAWFESYTGFTDEDDTDGTAFWEYDL